jgi:hypothetical protein
MMVFDSEDERHLTIQHEPASSPYCFSDVTAAKTRTAQDIVGGAEDGPNGFDNHLTLQ